MIQSPNISRKATTAPNSQLPVCQRNLSFKKDGAKYYTPVSLVKNDKNYTPAKIKSLFLNYLNLYLADNPLLLEQVCNHKIPITQPLIDSYQNKNPEITILKDWLYNTHDVIKNDVLLDDISKEMRLTSENTIIKVFFYYRDNRSQEITAGKFHEDGKNDKNPAIQILYPLDNSEMGTLFIPNQHKQRFINTHTVDKEKTPTDTKVCKEKETTDTKVCKEKETTDTKVCKKKATTDTKVYKEKTRVGIVEQADPNKMIAMLRHKHNNSVIHAVPNDINHSSNPIRRPLLVFLVYKEES